jgi:hypothetical protein
MNVCMSSFFIHRIQWKLDKQSVSTHVEPDNDAEGSPSPVFFAFSGSPFSSGFVAAFLNDCSKSAMISSICSVPTEIRMRSYTHSLACFPNFQGEVDLPQ